MSLKQLESMLKKLEQSDKESKASNKGGFIGVGHDSKKSLKESGGSKASEFGRVFTGKGLTGGILRPKPSCKVCEACTCGGRLSGGGVSGGYESLLPKLKRVAKAWKNPKGSGITGGETINPQEVSRSTIGGISNFDGSGKGAKKKKGGNIKNFDGSGLTGGVSNFDGSGLTGGKCCGGKAPKQLNAWRSFLNDYRMKHSNLSMKQAMQGASKAYKK